MIRRGVVLAILAVGITVPVVAYLSNSARPRANVELKAMYPPAQAVGGASLAHATTTTQVFSIENAEAEIEALLDSEIPEESCIVMWDDPECPEVYEVEVTYTGEEGEDEEEGIDFMLPWSLAQEGTDPGYGTSSGRSLLASNRTADDSSLVSHSPNWACGVNAKKPVIYIGEAEMTAKHHCWAGQGVTRMEMWGDLQRYSSVAPLRWYTLDTCFRGPYGGATTQQCDAEYNCYHPESYRKYRGSTAGYAVRSGTGYFGVDYSPVRFTFCS